VIALSHIPGIPEQLALEWGVFAMRMEAADSVDDLIDAALAGARDVAGLPPGAVCVITAGRIGIAGATNMIMIREIPEP
jgi:pyruvate kinase